jgi:sulfate permease, SulP family
MIMPAMSGDGWYRATRRRCAGALFASLRGYQRSWALADGLAALGLLVIAVPEQLATARLAGMPPITGFDAFAAGTALFALLGSSPQLSVGADSTIAPLFAVAIARLASPGSPRYVELVALTAVSVGVLVGLVWLLRLGWVAEFLSAPIVTGFLAGVAVIIVVHQLPDLFGLPGPDGSTLHRITVIARNVGRADGWSLGIGASVFAIVFAAERVDRRLPGALFGMVASTIVVAALGLRADGVAVLGTIAHGAPRIGLPGLSFAALTSVAPVAAVIALVVVSQTAATTRAFADREGYEVDVGRDLLGVGAGSIVAGLAGAFPVNASPPRTAAVVAAGGRTQAAGLGAAAVVVLLIPAAGVLRDVPLATLSGVLVFVATRIFHAGDLAVIARFDRFEFALAAITLLTVAVVGVEEGIGVAVGLAILDRTRLAARAHVRVLERIPGTTSWALVTDDEAPVEPSDVLVVLFATPLWYANAVQFRAQMRARLEAAPHELSVVVLDTIGMSDIDYTGSRAFAKILDELDRRGVSFAVARVGDHLRENLARSGLLDRIGSENVFPSVDAAVSGCSRPPDGTPRRGPPD